ncbi:acetoin utilization protein AcuC [Paenibacillus aquistagni]|uniref:Acetoin utilization protein AcuC n=1 Tax=Paenibacillus aquistagni TaxID=1852522 RepID=A0A1X7IHT5_9BACL|nr:acetoin utilization protein AcuC [Paenibacillus aquistagni]SMG14312.1 acetoin utilization protein AcuC [Paenibacillus aquistagni]
MSNQPVFIFNEEVLKYRFYQEHPFDQFRVLLTNDLLMEIGALSKEQLHSSVPASLQALQRIHREDYIEAVIQLSEELPDPDWILRAQQYGLHDEETPYFIGMHQAAASIAGGSIAACEAVMSGQASHALHLGGGLHHAFPERGAGFCVYNDAAVAISHIHEKYQARVLYIDTDVHHGDGVQWSFYTDPHVLTYSIHETGKYLFPGTGFVHERGEGEGFGACVNVPLDPYTEDDSWLDCFKRTVEQTAAVFKPDLIVSQHGCDAHALDPLSHMHCSMKIYKEMPRIIHEAAHAFCDGKWVALGGGGYDIWRVVPRAWSLLWLEMIDHPLAAQLDHSPILPLPESWIQRWKEQAIHELPTTWLDDVSTWTPMPRRSLISEHNLKVSHLAMEYVR